MMTIMIILQVQASVRVMYEWCHSCLIAAPKHYNGWSRLYCFILFFLCYQLLNSVTNVLRLTLKTYFRGFAGSLEITTDMIGQFGQFDQPPVKVQF